jgi:hypothetical protein
VQDALLHQGAQTVEGGSAVDMVKAALLARDEALQKVRTALAEAQTAAAEREMALAMVQAQLQQDCATLEGARSWQNQAKKAERLGADLADKVTSLDAVGSSSARSRVHASRRRIGSSRSSLPSRRPRLPLSTRARPGRKRRANSSGSTLHWRRRGPPSRSGTRRLRGSPGSWSRRVCPTRICGWPARRTPSSLSCNRRPPLRAPPLSRRRSRSRVSCSP